MFKVHGYLDGKLVINWRMDFIPRVGEIVRFDPTTFGKVVEVAWCLDEERTEGEGVNIRMETT